MAKKIYCKRCGKVLKRNEVYIPLPHPDKKLVQIGIDNDRYIMESLCFECYKRVYSNGLDS